MIRERDSYEQKCVPDAAGRELILARRQRISVHVVVAEDDGHRLLRQGRLHDGAHGHFRGIDHAAADLLAADETALGVQAQKVDDLRALIQVQRHEIIPGVFARAQDRLLALKELCRNRFYLVDMAGDLKRKLIALIDRVFPEYEAQFDTIFCKSSVAVLKKYPTPQKLSNAHLDKLTELLWNSSNGHFGEWKARELRELARNSFGVEDCDGAYSTLILLMLDQIQSLSGKADALEKEISRLFQSFDTTVTTIPGVGPIIGAVILSEVGDISRFSSADKLAAYIGVDPSVNQSGEFQAAHAHMSKRGSPYLRRCIWMASQVAVQRDPMFRAYYEKKAAEGLKYMTIIGHVTRKMTAVVFAILRDHKVYEPVLPTAA